MAGGKKKWARTTKEASRINATLSKAKQNVSETREGAAGEGRGGEGCEIILSPFARDIAIRFRNRVNGAFNQMRLEMTNMRLANDEIK